MNVTSIEFLEKVKSKHKIIDFVGKSKLYFIVSAVMIGITLLYTVIFGVEVDISFKGGNIIVYEVTGDVDVEKVEAETSAALGKSVTATIGEAIGGKGKTISLSFPSEDKIEENIISDLEKVLVEKVGLEGVEYVDNNSVSPSAGFNFLLKSVVAVAFAFLVLVVYIAFRFKKISGWSAGVVAIICLLHDVIMAFAAFAFFRIPLDANFMAVVLTILGYSINNTIIIYDRIRENKVLYDKRLDDRNLVNLSITQTLARSINTSACTFLVMVVVVIVALAMNVTSIISFAFPLSVGIAVGLYTSTFLAGSMWIWWQERAEKSVNTKKKNKKAAVKKA